MDSILSSTILLVFIFSLSSCANLKQLVTICDETPSTEHLVLIRNVNFDSIKKVVLASPINHNIEYCSEHFLPSTKAGHNFGAARDAINSVEGSLVHFTGTASNHKTGNQLVNSNQSIFGYISPEDELPHGFSSNFNFTLLWYGHTSNIANQNEHFTIFINENFYDHSENINSDDYPNIMGILHELAHAAGMKHTRNKNTGRVFWDADDTKYISSMQGGLRYLSALDVAFLRHYYSSGSSEHRNYVAGTKTRIPNSDNWFESKSFYKKNPQSLYLDNQNRLKDCKTDEDPIFYVSWFNTGTISSETDRCGLNRIYLRKVMDRYSNSGITLQQWKIAPMPFLSQDQKVTTGSIHSNAVSRLDFGSEYDLVYHVNALATLDEIRSDDNEVSYPIQIFSNAQSCPDPSLIIFDDDEDFSHD